MWLIIGSHTTTHDRKKRKSVRNARVYILNIYIHICVFDLISIIIIQLPPAQEDKTE